MAGRTWVQAACVVSVVLGVPALARQGPVDEPPPKFTAADLLAPAELEGPHHRVEPAVHTDTYFHEFTLTSAFGTFEAAGRSQLAVRIHEIEALAKLDEVSKTEVFLKAAGRSVVNVGEGVVSAVKDPTETAKGLGSGIKRFGVNLGRRTKRAVDSAQGGDDAGDDAPKDNTAESAAMSVLGVSSAMRRWARKVGVDPYTTNAPLRQALKSIGEADAAGSIATSIAVPIPRVVGMTATVGDLVWSQDPEQVRKINEQRLKELGAPAGLATTLNQNRWFTLTYQTRLVAALHQVRAAGSADYAQTAAEARSEREALFFVESAELMAGRHAREPIVGLLTDSRALVAKTKGGVALALLPLDWLRRTPANDQAIREMTARARKELAAAKLEIVLTGRASDAMARELKTLGLAVVPPPSGP